MEINIDLTRDDFANFNKYYFLNKGLKKRIYLVLLVALGLPFIIGSKGPFNILTYIVMVLFAGLLFGSLYLGGMYLFVILSKRLPSKDGAILGKKKIKITDEGLIEESENNITIQKWKGIKAIETNNKYIFIFVDKIAAYIIPKRFFKEESEQNTFITTLKEKIKDAK